MLLQHFTDNCRQIRLLSLVMLPLLLAGCATGIEKPPNSESSQGTSGAAGGPVESRLVPAAAQTLYEQATAAMASGDNLDAALRFQEFLLQYPDYPGAHVNLAIIHVGNGDDTAAEASITDALLIDPEHSAALNQLGMLLRRQGKFLAAESAYMKAVATSPDYALAYYNLGVLNDLYLQRLEVALQHYERYQEIAGEEKQVSRWIADLNRRIQSTQRSANVTE